MHLHLQLDDLVLKMSNLLKKLLPQQNQIGLGEDYDRRDVRLECEGDVAFQACDVEVLVAGRHDEDRVDIGGNQLDLSIRTRSAALDEALSFQNPARLRMSAIEQRPVANRCIGQRWERLVDALADDMQRTAMHFDDADRRCLRQLVGADLRCEIGLPAECFEWR